MPFLVIGGLCITLYGAERLTRDIDLLVPETAKRDWRLLVEGMGYRFIHGTDSFQQFEDADANADGNLADLDLMLVSDDTWQKLNRVGRDVEIEGGVLARLPDPLHYVAMKLQAVRSASRRADNQDWSDILNVCRLFSISPRVGQAEEIVLRYGGEELLQKLESDLSKMP
jgi:hypothetical protein